MINENIFNLNKQDHLKTPLFLGENPGLFDTVNKQYPVIWDLYKKMKSLDWDENEFSFQDCNREFKSCPKSVYDMMIKTLAWQWEADSTAARSIAPIVAPFVSSSELWAAWQRVADNEVVHAATYSEIVRNSFDDPSVIVNEVLSVKQSVTRLSRVAKVFSETYNTSHSLALGLSRKDNDVVYDAIFMFTVALLALERIQFMSSFAVTFAIADTGLFLPIGKAVQKICQDEFEVHVELDKAILLNELRTPRGWASFNRNKQFINDLIDEVVKSELEWNTYAFSEGRELAGLNQESLNAWVKFNAADVYKFFSMTPFFQAPSRNPLGFMEEWMSIGKTQSSPQEEKVGQYMLGMVVDTVGEQAIDVDF